MNILHISASHENKALHAFSYHFKMTCRKLGYVVNSVNPFVGGWITKDIDYRFGKENFKDFYIGKSLFPLSRVLNDYPDSDFIFIENPKFPFNNDVDIPVVYYHRDIFSKLYCTNPTHLGIRFSTAQRAPDGRPNGGQPEIIERNWPEVWYDNNIRKFTMCHAISEDEFDEFSQYNHVKRSKRGFAYYGSYKSVVTMMHHNSAHYIVYKHHSDIIQFIKKHKLATEFREINESLNEYKRHLFEFDATMIIPAWDSWETRRLYEASYCKCVPILYIQNKSAEKVFKEQGYVHDETCITFDTLESLKKLRLVDHDLEKIRKKGYEMVKEQYTYEACIHRMLEKINIREIILKNEVKKFINSNINNNINKVIKTLEAYRDRVII